MKTYILKCKNCKDILSKVTAHSFEEALEYFSKIKNLPKSSIIDIYSVVEL